MSETRRSIVVTSVNYQYKGLYSVSKALFILSLMLLGIYYIRIGRYPLYDWLGMAAAFIVLFTSIKNNRLPKYRISVIASTILFIIGGATTLFYSVIDTQEALLSIIHIIYVVCIWIPLASIVLRGWGDIKLAYVALTLSMVVTCLYAIGQRYLDWPILGSRVDFWGRMPGLMRHPNELGTYCGLVFPLSLCLINLERKLLLKIIWLMVSVIGVVGIIISGSITGAIVLLFGSFTFLWINKGGAGSSYMTSFILMLVVGLAISTVITNGVDSQNVIYRMVSFVNDNQGRTTLGLRLAANEYAWSEIAKNPFIGHGFHSEAENVNTLIHNGILGTWFGGGIFALLGVIILQIGALGELFRFRKWTQGHASGDQALLISAAGASFSGFLIMSLAAPILDQRSSLFSIAIVFSVANIVNREITLGREQEINTAILGREM